MMQSLNLPQFKWDIRKEAESTTIFDAIRKKHVILTPEEWVRQHFVHYLMSHLNYPKSLISMERGLAYNRLKKRTDILIYDRTGIPFMLVECKASHVKIDTNVFKQASVYNKTLKASYLVVTNGLQHFCCFIDHTNSSYKFIDQLPVFE